MKARSELHTAGKVVYSLGDFTVNTALSALGLIYASYFLTQVAGLRPALAGLVPLLPRVLDAVADPLMGRISDMTRWSSGRRRPFFLIGAIPFGLMYALLWFDPGFESQGELFAFYSLAYLLVALAMTVVSVPYLALIPEMALDYDARTSLNTYRSIGALVGVLAAISIRPLANLFGGGFTGFSRAGIAFGFLLALPWFAVWAVSFERNDFRHRETGESFVEGIRTLFRHRSFMRLTAILLTGRIAMDLISALLILYFTFWIGRSEDFEIAMVLFLLSVVASLPVWLRLAQGRDKAHILLLGTIGWMATSFIFLFAQPDWPRWILMVVPPLAGIGYAVVDLMPWAMLGEVIDEDDLASGERREGLYNGMFTFLRKLGGALGVFLVMSILDLAGFRQGAEQTETVRQTIRILTVAGPVTFLAIAAWLAHDYPLTRKVHNEIVERLAERDRLRRSSPEG